MQAESRRRLSRPAGGNCNTGLRVKMTIASRAHWQAQAAKACVPTLPVPLSPYHPLFMPPACHSLSQR